jgi:class 3 adenylate cyclase
LASERVERRLTAILAADVAGYSRLMGADEVGTLAQATGVSMFAYSTVTKRLQLLRYEAIVASDVALQAQRMVPLR